MYASLIVPPSPRRISLTSANGIRTTARRRWRPVRALIDVRGAIGARLECDSTPRDTDFALKLVLERCRSREQQERAVAALKFKCELLWAMLDAIYLAYVVSKKS